jgi:hypothetical protein
MRRIQTPHKADTPSRCVCVCVCVCVNRQGRSLLVLDPSQDTYAHYLSIKRWA